MDAYIAILSGDRKIAQMPKLVRDLEKVGLGPITTQTNYRLIVGCGRYSHAGAQDLAIQVLGQHGVCDYAVKKH